MRKHIIYFIILFTVATNISAQQPGTSMDSALLKMVELE
jgi:hypothetical protein